MRSRLPARRLSGGMRSDSDPPVPPNPEGNSHVLDAGLCLAAGSAHLPPEKGEVDQATSDVSDLAQCLRYRNRQQPISVGGREGVAIPTPSLPFSRGGRRLRLSRN